MATAWPMMTETTPTAAGPEPSAPRPRYLHAARPDGDAYLWHPVKDAEHLAIVIGRLAPHVPTDATWNVTDNTYSPETAPPPEPELPVSPPSEMVAEPEVDTPVVLEGQGSLPIETTEEPRHDPT